MDAGNFRRGQIERFEAWLTQPMFWFLVVLLIVLNLYVWFKWLPQFYDGRTADIVAGLQTERDHLKEILEGSCTSEEMKAYGNGELGPLAPTAPLSPSPSPSASPNTNSTPLPQDSLVGQLQSAAVLVRNGNYIGSGFFIDAQTIVTNRHVIENAKTGKTSESKLTVASHALGGVVSAQIVTATQNANIGSADFALIRIERPSVGVKPLSLARDPIPLQHVVAVGFPGSGIQSDANRALPSPIFTSGDVSVLQPQPTGISLVIHTADISPGSSGGALVDRCGGVVGVNTFVFGDANRFESRRLYALSSDSLRKFLDASGQHYSSVGDCQSGRGN
jgi:S1-C subfamily serine protease